MNIYVDDKHEKLFSTSAAIHNYFKFQPWKIFLSQETVSSLSLIPQINFNVQRTSFLLFES
jgi:hypothetical protein